MIYTVADHNLLETKVHLLDSRDECTLLKREIPAEDNGIADPTPYLVAWGFTAHEDGTCAWEQALYCPKLDDALSILRLRGAIRMDPTEQAIDLENDDELEL